MDILTITVDISNQLLSNELSRVAPFSFYMPHLLNYFAPGLKVLQEHSQRGFNR